MTEGFRPSAAVLGVVCLLAASAAPSAGDSALGEAELRAGFVFNFLKFVEWPEEAFAGSDSPLIVGVAADDADAPVLERLLWGRAVTGRPLVVRRFEPDSAPGPCHVLLLAGGFARRGAAVLEVVSEGDVLTIGDSEGAVDVPVAIRFVRDGQRLRFEINLAAPGMRRLKVSSRLLQLARRVRGDAAKGR